MTAAFGAACGHVYTNPAGPTTEPTTQPVDTASPDATTAPTTTPTTAPTTTGGAPVGEIPKDAKGHVRKQKDGTCLYFAPEPEMDCPPGASCNPGPPQDPVVVKCPADAKGP